MLGRGPLHLLAVSAVVMALAQTIARERLFAPLRARLGGKETWLGYLRVAFWLFDEEQGLIRRRQRTEDEEAAARRLARERLERRGAVRPRGAALAARGAGPDDAPPARPQ